MSLLARGQLEESWHTLEECVLCSMKYILDSNILIGMSLNDKAMFDFFEKNKESELCVSSITLTEVLWHKNITKQEKDHLELLLESIDVVAIDEEIARSAIKWRQEHNLKTIDSLIVATAESMKAKLLTRDKDILKLCLGFVEKI